MKSQWDVIYFVSHTNIFIKKLQRYLTVDISNIETERLEHDGKKLERATFLVHHSSTSWNSVIEEVLVLAQKVSGRWQLNLEFPDSIRGYLTENSEGNVESIVEAPSNLESISWKLKRNQKYNKIIYSSKTNAW